MESRRRQLHPRLLRAVGAGADHVCGGTATGGGAWQPWSLHGSTGLFHGVNTAGCGSAAAAAEQAGGRRGDSRLATAATTRSLPRACSALTARWRSLLHICLAQPVHSKSLHDSKTVNLCTFYVYTRETQYGDNRTLLLFYLQT